MTAEETKVDSITQGFQVGRRENRRKETEEKPSVKGRQRKRSQHWGLSFVGTKSGKKRQLRSQGRKISRREWPTRHMQETSRKMITEKFQMI